MKPFSSARELAKTLTIVSICLLVAAVILVAAYQNFTLSVPQQQNAFAAKCLPYLLGLGGFALLSGIWFFILKEIDNRPDQLGRLQVFRFIRRKHDGR